MLSHPPQEFPPEYAPPDEGWFRAPFAVPAVGLVELSAEPRIVRANGAFCRMTGYAAAELAALPAADLLFPEDRDRVLADLAAVAAGRAAAYETDRRYRRKDGSPLWARVAVARDAAADPPRVAAVVTDLSEQRRLEEHVRRAQRAEAAGLLAAGMAHDFNNLLTVINGVAQVLLDELPGAGPARELAQGMADTCRRAAELAGQLLTSSRDAPAEPRAIDLDEVVARTARLLRPALGKDVALVTRAGGDPCWVEADPRQVEQVLLNLAVNARDAMPGGGRLTIETRRPAAGEWAGDADPPPGEYVVLAVTDTGTGMTDEVRARAFEPFFTTKSPGKGTGLGLPMVRRVVERCGGRVGLTTGPGAGTTIHILLPAVRPEPPR